MSSSWFRFACLGCVGTTLCALGCASDVDGTIAEAEQALSGISVEEGPVADIKTAIKEYFDSKYTSMSTLRSRSFDHLVSEPSNQSTFWKLESNKRRVELANAIQNNLGYTAYKYSLVYDSVDLAADGTQATVKLREGHDVNFAINPAVTSKMRNLVHNISLQKIDDRWKLVDDAYDDLWSRYIKESGLSADDLIASNKKRVETALANPHLVPDAAGSVVTTGVKRAGSAYYYYYPLDRTSSINYAYTWWSGRNPAYYDFEYLGGDCTNFISQCLRAGGAPNDGAGSYQWYYYTSTNRTASWTGVEELFYYLVNNYDPIGPYGYNTDFYSVSEGDMIQLRFASSGGFQHSMYITYIYRLLGYNANLYLTAHTNNVVDYPLTSIGYNAIRYIRIGGYLQ